MLLTLYTAPLFIFCISGGEFFFFQAEDGIRDLYVTGVQTCALPIYPGTGAPHGGHRPAAPNRPALGRAALRFRRAARVQGQARSEERRVGKECRSRWL